MKVRRVPIVDEYAEGEQVAVFVGEQVLVLSAVATAAWEATGTEWTKLSTVTDIVVEAVGAPPGVEPEDAVAGLLGDLAQVGLVEIS